MLGRLEKLPPEESELQTKPAAKKKKKKKKKKGRRRAATGEVGRAR